MFGLNMKHDSCFIKRPSARGRPQLKEDKRIGGICMDISKHKTLLIVLIAILWIACIITGTTGHFVLGMCLGVALMFLHMILGVAKQGKVSKQFLLYPLPVSYTHLDVYKRQAMFYVVNYPAAVSAYATDRQLPIYCVQRDQKMLSISFEIGRAHV